RAYAPDPTSYLPWKMPSHGHGWILTFSNRWRRWANPSQLPKANEPAASCALFLRKHCFHRAESRPEIATVFWSYLLAAKRNQHQKFRFGTCNIKHFRRSGLHSTCFAIQEKKRSYRRGCNHAAKGANPNVSSSVTQVRIISRLVGRSAARH